MIREPSLVECVFTVSHTYCFLTQWIQCCYAWGFLEQFNHREPWDETLNFYRSSRSTITNKDKMINTRDAEHVESWKCCQTVDVSHPSHYFIFSQGLALFLEQSPAIILCSSLFFCAQSDPEFFRHICFPKPCFHTIQTHMVRVNLSHCPSIFVPPLYCIHQ